MFEDVISSVLQVLAFSLIPGIVYLIWFRKKTSFFNYLGLKPAPPKALGLAAIASLLFLVPPILMVLIEPEFKEILSDPTTLTGRFALEGLSMGGMISILVTAGVKTALAEEILFRGFAAKRLIAWLGFSKGNLLQALLFGLIHVLIFIPLTDSISFMVFIFSFSSLGAWVSAFLNERRADGSILPGWIAHAVANIGSYTIIGLVLL